MPLPKAVLITGAARRMGRALALDLAADGWLVGVHYGTSRHEAETVVAEIGQAGGRAAAVSADLACDNDVQALLPRCGAALGCQPCCLINNASLFEDDTLATLTLDSWERHFAINLKAPVFLAQAMARHLPEGQNGNVVNIIDQRVWRLSPEFLSYTLAKSGLWTATRTLAQALAPRIRVNAIGPGPVLQSIHQSAEDFAREAAATPLARATSLAEITAAVRFILSAPAMTGQMIALDDGQHLEWRGSLAPAAGQKGSL